jgi:hypothetical protein
MIKVKFSWAQLSWAVPTALLLLGSSCQPNSSSVIISDTTNPTSVENGTEYTGDWHVLEPAGELNTDLTADAVAILILNDVDVLGSIYAVRPQPVQR